MARPSRNSDPDQLLSSERTFFVTTKMSMGRALLQSERNAILLLDVLRQGMAAQRFGASDAIYQGRIFVSSEERIGIRGGSLATWIFGSKSRKQGELSGASRIYRPESGESGAGGFSREVSLLFRFPCEAESTGAEAQWLGMAIGTAKAVP